MVTEPERTSTVPPRDAATLLVLRPAETGNAAEVFCVRRHGMSAFMGGVVVFPGGKLDAGDGDPAFTQLTLRPHPRAGLFARDRDHARALAVCACRESLEEAAIMPARPAVNATEADALRRRLAGGADFQALLRERALALDLGALVPFARWITPAGEARRYDARFFMTQLPPGQRGEHDARETTGGMWATAGELLASYQTGDLFLAPPTIRALELLRDAGDIEATLRLCARQTLEPVCPQFVPGDPPMLVLPGDPLHTVPEPRVAGGSRFVIRDGRFVSTSAPA